MGGCLFELALGKEGRIRDEAMQERAKLLIIDSLLAYERILENFLTTSTNRGSDLNCSILP
jgi:hypothetical protein